MGSYIRVSVIQVYCLEWCVINQTDVAIGVYTFFKAFPSTSHARMKIKVFMPTSKHWQRKLNAEVTGKSDANLRRKV